MQTHRHQTDTPTPRQRSRPSAREARTVMWVAIGLTLALFGLLLAFGWDDNAATTAAAALLVACVAVCIWAGVQGRTTDREVDRAIARLAATREQNQRRMPGDPETVRFPSGELDLYGRLRHCSDDAPTLVLLSGVGFHTFEYEPLGAHLAAGGFNSLSFDFRGHGRSGGRRGAWILDELAGDSRHAVDFARRRYRGPIGLFGNSLGAMVAILTGTNDDRVLGVAAANCPARIADFLLTRPRRALFALAKPGAPLAPIRISLKHFYSYDQLIDDRSWVSTFERDPLIADARRLSVRTFTTLLEHWDGPSAVSDLHKPLLLIQGRNDHLQPPQQSQLLFEAANDPKKYEIVDTGHLPHLEDPETLAGVLIDWFSGLTR